MTSSIGLWTRGWHLLVAILDFWRPKWPEVTIFGREGGAGEEEGGSKWEPKVTPAKQPVTQSDHALNYA